MNAMNKSDVSTQRSDPSPISSGPHSTAPFDFSRSQLKSNSNDQPLGRAERPFNASSSSWLSSTHEPYDPMSRNDTLISPPPHNPFPSTYISSHSHSNSHSNGDFSPFPPPPHPRQDASLQAPLSATSQPPPSAFHQNPSLHVSTPSTSSSSRSPNEPWDRDREKSSTLRLADLEPWMDDAYATQVCDLMGWHNVSVRIPPRPNLPNLHQSHQPPHPPPLQPNNPGYCFLTFRTHADASHVLSDLQNTNTSQLQNGHSLVLLPNSKRPMNLSWANHADSLASLIHAQQEIQQRNQATSVSSLHASTPSDISRHQSPIGASGEMHHSASNMTITPSRAQEFSIFVGDLAPEVTNADLVEVFKNPSKGVRPDSPRSIRPFASCKSAKIMVDTTTGASRGYGFVRFTDEADRTRALIEMQGLYCLSRPMRISPATAKGKAAAGSSGGGYTPSQPSSRPSSHAGLPHSSQASSYSSPSPVSTSSAPPFTNDYGQQHQPQQQLGQLPGQGRSVSSPIAQSTPTISGLPVSQSYGSYPSHAPSRAFPIGQVNSGNGSRSSSYGQDQQQHLLQRPLSSLSAGTYSSGGYASPPPALHMDGPGMSLQDVPPALIAQIAQLVASGQLSNINGLGLGMGSGAMSPVSGRDSPASMPPYQQPQSYPRPPNNQHQHRPSLGDGGGLSRRNTMSPSNMSNMSSMSQSDGEGSRAALETMLGPNGSDPYNTTVFVGGLSGLIPEETLRSFFSPFGEIHYVKIPPGKGCGFVQFVHKADAERAIERMQGYSIGGGKIRLSWGRSQYKAAQAAAQASNNLGLSMTMTNELPDHFGSVSQQLQSQPQQQQLQPQSHQRTSSISGPNTQASFPVHSFGAQEGRSTAGDSNVPQMQSIRRSGVFSPFSPDPNAGGGASAFGPSPSNAGYDLQQQGDVNGQFSMTSYQFDTPFMTPQQQQQQQQAPEPHPFTGGPLSLYPSFEYSYPSQRYAHLDGENEDPRFDPSFHMDGSSADSSQHDVNNTIAHGMSSLSIGGYSAAPGPPSNHSGSSNISPPDLQLQTTGLLKQDDI